MGNDLQMANNRFGYLPILSAEIVKVQYSLETGLEFFRCLS